MLLRIIPDVYHNIHRIQLFDFDDPKISTLPLQGGIGIVKQFE